MKKIIDRILEDSPELRPIIDVLPDLAIILEQCYLIGQKHAIEQSMAIVSESFEKAEADSREK